MLANGPTKTITNGPKRKTPDPLTKVRLMEDRMVDAAIKEKLDLGALTKIPGKVRIAWSIPPKKGHGDWWHPYDEPFLQGQCNLMNRQYGSGSHWIERRDG